MSFSSIQTSNGVFLVWADVNPASIKRSSDNGETWTSIFADLTATSYVDTTAEYDVPYVYRLTTVTGTEIDTSIKRIRLNRYHYKSSYIFGDKPNLDLTLMARIQNVDENKLLPPSVVTGITRDIISVYYNDVTAEPVETTIESAVPIFVGDVLLNTCVRTSCWDLDDYGFNFRDVFPGGFPAGVYIAKYTITTTDRPDPIEILIPFEIERLKEERQ